MLAPLALAVVTLSLSAAPPPVVVDARALPKPGEHVLVGAGDIADCGPFNASASTALIVEQVLASSAKAHAFTAGDNAYDRGTLDEFRRCYAPTWGRFRDRTLPVAGNHEWLTPGAAGHFEYFGKRAGSAAVPWRSLEIGAWHVVLLESDCDFVGGCGPTSPQAAWLRADLARWRSRRAEATAADTGVVDGGPGDGPSEASAGPAKSAGQPVGECALAIWHHPRFSSGLHGNDDRTAHLWSLFRDGGGDVVIAGHDHTYERFGARDGLPSFVVGTGGRAAYPLRSNEAASLVRFTGVPGVLVMFLDAAGYRFFFVDTEGKIRDSGAGSCR